MTRPGPLLAAIALAGLCTAAAMPSQANQDLNIVVVGFDQDARTLSRSNRVYGRVAGAIAGQLQQAGFAVFDERYVTAGQDVPAGDGRLADRAVLDAAHLLDAPPVDLVALFSVHPHARTLRHSRRLSIRIDGRLLNVQSGQRLGNFEVTSPQPLAVALACSRDCQLEHLGDEARILGQHVGAVLAARLDAIAPASGMPSPGSDAHAGLTRQFALTFNNFSDEDIADIEELLAAFSGYRLHRPVRCQPRFCQYWYETTSSSARLRRNLQMMLVHLGFTGTVVFSGNVAMVEKIVPPVRRASAGHRRRGAGDAAAGAVADVRTCHRQACPARRLALRCTANPGAAEPGAGAQPLAAHGACPAGARLAAAGGARRPARPAGRSGRVRCRNEPGRRADAKRRRRHPGGRAHRTRR